VLGRLGHRARWAYLGDLHVIAVGVGDGPEEAKRLGLNRPDPRRPEPLEAPIRSTPIRPGSTWSRLGPSSRRRRFPRR
jgi:hypothetical protein